LTLPTDNQKYKNVNSEKSMVTQVTNQPFLGTFRGFFVLFTIQKTQFVPKKFHFLGKEKPNEATFPQEKGKPNIPTPPLSSVPFTLDSEKPFQPLEKYLADSTGNVLANRSRFLIPLHKEITSVAFCDTWASIPPTNLLIFKTLYLVTIMHNKAQ